MDLKQRDEVIGLGIIERVSDHFVWINGKRHSRKKISKKDILYYNNPNIKVDWSNKKAVSEFSNSFKNWKVNIQNKDITEYKIYEVKDNMVFFNGEYYLPWKYNERPVIESEYIFGFLVKGKQSYYDESFPVNLFATHSLVSEQDIRNQRVKEENFDKLDTLNYLRSIPDYNRIDANDLTLFKDNLLLLLEDFLPNKVNDITFEKGMFGKINVRYRNRIGWLEIDNSYHGRMPFGNEYGLRVRISPCFTNEACYSFNISNIKFDESLFINLVQGIRSKWDKAIEMNARNWG